MPRILCRYDVCVFNKDSQCTAKQIEYDPDQGCLTAQDRNEFVGILDDEDEWDEEEDELAADDEETGGVVDDEDDEDDELFEDDDLETELDDDDL